MEQSAGNEHVRPELTTAEALCVAIEAHEGNVFVRSSPLRPILPLLVAYVRVTQIKLATLERAVRQLEGALHPPQRPDADLVNKALSVVDIARAEGMVEPPMQRPAIGICLTPDCWRERMPGRHYCHVHWTNEGGSER
jgi:hypothetical protein